MITLIGAGGLAIDFLSYNKNPLYATLVDDLKTGSLYGHSITGTISKFIEEQKMNISQKLSIVPEVYNCIGSVGNNKIRNEVFEKLTQAGIKTYNIIMGSFIAKDVTFGKNIVINVGTQIHHSTIVGDNCVISPSVTICGNCDIDENVFIGCGSIIIQGIHIGKNSVIAAGAVVTRDVPPNQLYGGCPAKRIGSA